MDQAQSDLQDNELFVYHEDTIICASSHMERDVKFHKSIDRLN
jgi:hypothetical protein